MNFVLLRDGRLVGPFRSKEDARYWALALDIKAYSSYDVFAPHLIENELKKPENT